MPLPRARRKSPREPSFVRREPDVSSLTTATGHVLQSAFLACHFSLFSRRAALGDNSEAIGGANLLPQFFIQPQVFVERIQRLSSLPECLKYPIFPVQMPSPPQQVKST